MADTTPDPAGRVEGYARAAAGRVQRLLGQELVGAHLIGSGALGGLVLEESDIDLAAVCAQSPSPADSRRLVAALTEEAMTWPVRGLEFVLYPLAALAIRHGDRSPALDPTRVRRFVREVRARVEHAAT